MHARTEPEAGQLWLIFDLYLNLQTESDVNVVAQKWAMGNIQHKYVAADPCTMLQYLAIY